MNFPSGFFFGAGTSSHQVEGGNRNDWTEWEKKNAKRLAVLARKKEWPEYIKGGSPSPLEEENYISGDATDHYSRYEEDFDIAKNLNHNAHRFSIEWSRIEPEEGIFDEKEIAHYRDVVRALRSRGIEPFVTLWHWTLPLWLSKRGGVMHKEFPRLFARYTEKIVRSLGNDVKFWLTLNEPEIYSLNGYMRGVWPPEKHGALPCWRAQKQLIKAHKSAYRCIKKISPGAQAGPVCNLTYFEPAGGPINTLIKWVAERYWNHYFLRHARKEMDFVGINYYFRNRIVGGRVVVGQNKKIDADSSDMGWDIYPQGISHVVRSCKKYKKPIYITEHGLADARDAKRARFIAETLRAVLGEIKNGADVRGYFHWSLLDNFEWDKGFWPRFGLVEVDYKTKTRAVRQSARTYQSIIKQGIL